jgi:hypothetical protein
LKERIEPWAKEFLIRSVFTCNKILKIKEEESKVKFNLNSQILQNQSLKEENKLLTISQLVKD